MIVAAALTAAVFALPSHAANKEEAAIEALEAQFAKAVASKNTDAIMKLYAPDDSLLVFDLVPPRQYVGAKAYRKDWEDTLAGCGKTRRQTAGATA